MVVLPTTEIIEPINLLKQFAYQYGSKLFFCTASAFEASKKPESKLSGFQLEQQINFRIFDDFCHKNQSIQVQFQTRCSSLLHVLEPRQ